MGVEDSVDAELAALLGTSPSTPSPPPAAPARPPPSRASLGKGLAENATRFLALPPVRHVVLEESPPSSQSRDDDDDDDDRSREEAPSAVSCDVCAKDISHYSLQQRSQHISRCLAQQAKTHTSTDISAPLFRCPSCSTDLSASAQTLRLRHLKSCRKRAPSDAAATAGTRTAPRQRTRSSRGAAEASGEPTSKRPHKSATATATTAAAIATSKYFSGKASTTSAPSPLSDQDCSDSSRTIPSPFLSRIQQGVYAATQKPSTTEERSAATNPVNERSALSAAAARLFSSSVHELDSPPPATQALPQSTFARASLTETFQREFSNPALPDLTALRTPPLSPHRNQAVDPPTLPLSPSLLPPSPSQNQQQGHQQHDHQQLQEIFEEDEDALVLHSESEPSQLSPFDSSPILHPYHQDHQQRFPTSPHTSSSSSSSSSDQPSTYLSPSLRRNGDRLPRSSHALLPGSPGLLPGSPYDRLYNSIITALPATFTRASREISRHYSDLLEQRKSLFDAQRQKLEETYLQDIGQLVIDREREYAGLSGTHQVPMAFIRLLEQPVALFGEPVHFPTPTLPSRTSLPTATITSHRTPSPSRPRASPSPFVNPSSGLDAWRGRIDLGSDLPSEDHRSPPSRSRADPDKPRRARGRPPSKLGVPTLPAAPSSPEKQRGRTAGNKAEQVSSYIQSNPTLYASILQFNPLSLQQFRQELASHNLKRSRKWLIEYFEDQGIPYHDSEKKSQRKQWD